MAIKLKKPTNLPELGFNERQLILNSARLEMDGRLLNQSREILNDSLSWDATLFYAKYHGVASLIYRNLKTIDKSDLIPRHANRFLLQLCHRNEYQNRLLSKVLHNLLESFAHEEVPVLVPKGIALVELVYGHFNLRPLIDINLVVAEDKFDTAKNLLLQRGYTILAQDPAQGRLFSQVHLVKREELEVHLLLQWHLVNWPRVQSVDMARVWREAQTACLSGIDALIPSSVDLVLYLCIQPDKRSFLNLPALGKVDPDWFVFAELTNNRLIRFVDVYEVIRNYKDSLDWPTLIERACETGLRGPVHTCLQWVNALLGPVVEPSVLEALRPASPNRIRAWLFEALISESLDHTRASEVKVFFRHWWLQTRLLYRNHGIQFLNFVDFMFPRRDELRLIYRLGPSRNLIAYYPFHVLRTFCLGLVPWLYRVLFAGRHSIIFSKP